MSAPLASPTTPTGAAAVTELRRTLGLADLTFIAIGTVIGSGIFLVPGVVLRETGTQTGPALLVWVAAGILSYLGALTYATHKRTISALHQTGQHDAATRALDSLTKARADRRAVRSA